jgi:hypothetical protein
MIAEHVLLDLVVVHEAEIAVRALVGGLFHGPIVSPARTLAAGTLFPVIRDLTPAMAPDLTQR